MEFDHYDVVPQRTRKKSITWIERAKVELQG
jgi:hypothetical protein